MVQYENEKKVHAGVKDILVQTEKNTGLGKQGKSSRHLCQNAKAKQQTTAPVPKDKITSSFEVTGVDFAGTLYVKTQGSMTIRIVHMQYQGRRR